MVPLKSHFSFIHKKIVDAEAKILVEMILSFKLPTVPGAQCMVNYGMRNTCQHCFNHVKWEACMIPRLFVVNSSCFCSDRNPIVSCFLTDVLASLLEYCWVNVYSALVMAFKMGLSNFQIHVKFVIYVRKLTIISGCCGS